MDILHKLQAECGVEAMPPNFIKMTVVAGVDAAVIPEVASANNSSVQVNPNGESRPVARR